jgi:tRNA nucleotidyltransferase (CCA-adding enzyme)
MTLALPRLEVPPEVVEIAERLEQSGHETWCVGGALRDAILRDAQSDFDLATSATPEQVQQLFRRTVPIGVRFGTVGVLDRARRMHEVTTFRRDVETDGRHAVVQYGVALEDDLARRDFTINALAYHPLREEWRDPFGGASDIERGVVRAVGEPAARFREDYLRILRALRFAARFGFRIEDATWAAACEAAPGLRGLSAERVRDEWFKGLSSARSVAELVRLWRESDAAAVWLPELSDVTPEVLREERDAVLLTVLLTAAPVAVLKRLKASGAEIARAQAIAVAPVEPAGPDDASVRRWLAAAGSAAEDVLTLRRWRTGAPAPWAPVADAILVRGDAIRREQLAVGGSDLLAAGVPAGPALGVVLGRLLERVLEDPTLNSRERLLALAREPG